MVLATTNSVALVEFSISTMMRWEISIATKSAEDGVAKMLSWLSEDSMFRKMIKVCFINSDHNYQLNDSSSTHTGFNATARLFYVARD